MRGTRDMHTGLAQLALERGDLAAAAEHLRADDLGEAAGLPQNPYRWRVAMAPLREAEGDREAALGLLARPSGSTSATSLPNVRPVPATRARVLAAARRRGRGPGVGAASEDLSPDDELSYLREYEHVTLARILLAQHARDGDAQRWPTPAGCSSGS